MLPFNLFLLKPSPQQEAKIITELNHCKYQWLISEKRIDIHLYKHHYKENVVMKSFIICLLFVFTVVGQASFGPRTLKLQPPRFWDGPNRTLRIPIAFKEDIGEPREMAPI